MNNIHNTSRRSALLPIFLILALLIVSIPGCSGRDDKVTVRVGSLTGSTTIGIVNLMEDENDYEFTIATQPDEIAALINNGSIDIALIPANLSAMLYNKTSGAIRVIDINTLGVLYCISDNPDIRSIEDLSGKTVITTGQGATPEYVIDYLLSCNNVVDCDLIFKADATEAMAALSQGEADIAILPQPAATSACMNLDGFMTAFSLNDAWDDAAGDSRMVTGVTVVRLDFLQEHPQAVDEFIAAHRASAEEALSDIPHTAELVVAEGIVPAAPVAERAIPYCNIVCITGEEMKSALSGYFRVLFDRNPQSIGGAVPGDDFYYLG